jgi:hypothetical protein
MTLFGYDYDHVLTAGIVPQSPYIVITGRTFLEYDDGLKKLAQEVPVYLRGVGPIGNHLSAGLFKSDIIKWMNVTTFYEDNDEEIAIIRRNCPRCEVVKVG